MPGDDFRLDQPCLYLHSGKWLPGTIDGWLLAGSRGASRGAYVRTIMGDRVERTWEQLRPAEEDGDAGFAQEKPPAQIIGRLHI